MSENTYVFTEEDFAEFNSYSPEKTEVVDDDRIVYDEDINMHLFRDGYFPTGSKKDMDEWTPTEVERTCILHHLAYLTAKDVESINLTEAEEEMARQVVAKYGGNLEMELIAAKYGKKTGVMNPWYTEFMPDIAVLEVCPGSIVLRDRHRSSIISGAAMWGSYICWLKTQNLELPFNESYDYNTIVDEGLAIYRERSGWGSIGHMYWCFKRLTVAILAVPSSWTDVYFGREKLGAVVIEPITVVDEIAYSTERAEINACVVATVHGKHKEYYTEKLEKELSVLNRQGFVHVHPPVDENFAVNKEYFYYGPFVAGLKGRVFPVAWSPPNWGLFLCSRNGEDIDMDTFSGSKKIFKHLMHQKLFGYVTGCSCANCVVEARYGNATIFGKIMMRKIGLFPGHVKGDGYPFITLMLGQLEGKVMQAMNPKECVAFVANSITTEQLDVGVREMLSSRGMPIDRYVVNGSVICRFKDEGEAKHIISTFSRKRVGKVEIHSRPPVISEISLSEEELQYRTGISSSFLTYMVRCGLVLSELGPGRYGYKKPKQTFVPIDKLLDVLRNGPQIGMTSYQLKFVIDCEDNVKRIVRHLNALREVGQVSIWRSPSGETFWRPADTRYIKKNKTELHYNIPQIRERGHRAGLWSKQKPTKPATPKVFQKEIR